MEIRNTRLYRDVRGGVIAVRAALDDHGVLAESEAEVIRGGEPREKPGPDIFGDDHWPDWEELVAKARKKLAAGKDGPPPPGTIGGKRYHPV